MSAWARRAAALAVLLGLAALAWAALHDILRQEPDTSLEWAALAACPVAAVLAGRWGFGKKGLFG